ncbi:30S ribosomal protein S4e [Candidatus Bathyarchaeota archaeon]|nr:MAG: 30S ribosomal protein S4e [Candidatus Bathyarchaeota archaeon]
MGKKGGSLHLKREASPKFWPIHRKEFTWAVKPRPGPHPINRCIPLVLIVREILGLAKTRKEARKIISQGKILVDGKVRRDDRFPAGLMDVISIPDLDTHYRILPSEKGLTLHSIDKKEAGFKLCRIENKTTVRGGHIQLNLHDGRNILIRVEDPTSPEEDKYRTLDTLMISIPDQEIMEYFRMEKGMSAILIDGKNIGKYGMISSIEEQPNRKRRRLLVNIEDESGRIYQSILDYAFVIGDETPRISLPATEE